MCIFAGEINQVGSTNICVSVVYPSRIISAKNNSGLTGKYKVANGNPLQLTVYCNQIQLSRNPYTKSGKPNTVMIIPFPVKPGGVKNRFKILDFSEYENVFNDLSELFPNVVPSDSGISGRKYHNRDTEGYLPIYNCESYNVTVASGYQHLQNINGKDFVIDTKTLNLIKKYYGKKFGFIVCVIKQSAQYYPLAFVHELKPDKKLFVPTRNIMGGNHQSKYLQNNIFSQYREFKPYNNYSLTTQDYDKDQIDDHFHEILMLDDEVIRHGVSRINKHAPNNQEILESCENNWDHKIFIINKPNTSSHRLIGKTGIRFCNPDNKKLQYLHNYLLLNKFPPEITFAGISSITMLQIGALYSGNHDVYI